MDYKITIPQPCSEDWNKMSSTQKGAFCKSCAKEVIDFTNTTKRELSRKLTKGESICGRFKPEQLNTPLPKVSQNQFRHKAVMLGFTSLLALGTPLAAQQSITPTQIEEHFVLGRIAQQPITKEMNTLTGVVKDFNNRPLSGINITLKGSTIKTQTNLKGEFSMVVPASKKLEKQVLWISSPDYETQEIILEKNTNPLVIKLEEQLSIMGDITILEVPKKKKDTSNKYLQKKNYN